MFFSAVVWHYWIAVALAVPALLLLVAVIVMYFTTVVAPQFPRDDEDQ